MPCDTQRPLFSGSGVLPRGQWGVYHGTTVGSGTPLLAGHRAPLQSKQAVSLISIILAVGAPITMATVYSMTFTVLGLVVMYSSLLVWTALILPAPVARARVRLETRPVASFFAGLGFFLLTVLGYAGFLLLRNPWMVTLDESLQQVAGALQFTRFYNDAFILANCAAWPLAAPAMVGWIIGGGGALRSCLPAEPVP